MFQFPGFALVLLWIQRTSPFSRSLLVQRSPPLLVGRTAGPKRRQGSACAASPCSASRLFGATEIEGGFPHSEIPGSKPVRGSPGLIAAYHVLHRLSAPRHPPDTLMALDCSHRQSAFSNSKLVTPKGSPIGKSGRTQSLARKDQFCFKRIRGSWRSAKGPTTGCSTSE